jgi:hypothetical protein
MVFSALDLLVLLFDGRYYRRCSAAGTALDLLVLMLLLNGQQEQSTRMEMSVQRRRVEVRSTSSSALDLLLRLNNMRCVPSLLLLPFA